MGQRPRTTSPAQALFLLNNPFVRDHAQHVAQRALEQVSAGDPLDAIFLQLLARRPTDSERESIMAFVQKKMETAFQ